VILPSAIHHRQNPLSIVFVSFHQHDIQLFAVFLRMGGDRFESRLYRRLLYTRSFVVFLCPLKQMMGNIAVDIPEQFISTASLTREMSVIGFTY
jgi:hypothetical protein